LVSFGAAHNAHIEGEPLPLQLGLSAIHIALLFYSRILPFYCNYSHSY